jgi:hypothetical protein
VLQELLRAERLEDRVRTVLQIAALSRHSVPVTSHPRVRGTHPGYRPHSPVPGQEERDSGAGSQGEPAPKGSFPPARSSGRGEKAVSATCFIFYAILDHFLALKPMAQLVFSYKRQLLRTRCVG